jgi:hypothetical protein
MLIRNATPQDVPEILRLIRALADYEKLSHEVVATEERLRECLFGPRPIAETVLACLDGRAIGFAVFFHSYSTFSGRAGLYLEDLFRRAAAPPQRLRQGPASAHSAAVGGAGLRAHGMVSTGLEHVGDRVLPQPGCAPPGRLDHLLSRGPGPQAGRFGMKPL